jgi:hypothetical protein
MLKKYFIVILILLTFIVGISGCTTKTTNNGTFGEKSISIDSIFISNNTTAGTYNNSDNGSEYYYIDGYLENNNSYDAFNVKVNATAYDANGTVVATNDSVYLNPTSIPGNGASEFYMDFPDSNNNIVRYDVKVVYATGTLY